MLSMQKQKWFAQDVNTGNGLRLAAFFLLSVVFLYPMYWMFCLSFKNEAEATARPFSLPTAYSFDNFRDVLDKIDLFGGMWNSFLYAIVISALICLICSMATYAILRMRKKSGPYIYRFFILGLSVPGMCLVVPVYMILKNLGLIGTFWAVVIPCVTGNLSTGILLLGAFMKTIPHEMEEAAAIDGCNVWRCFWKIIVPMSTSAIATRFALSFLAIWNEYSSFKIFCLGKSRQPVTLMIASFFDARYSIHWGQVGAAILISSLPSIIIYCICNRQLESAMTVGTLTK